MDTQDLISAFDTFAPTYLANDWDNVGLLVGSPDWPANKIMLAIDLTEAVLLEAINKNVEAIVSYHPPIFHPLNRLTNTLLKQQHPLQMLLLFFSFFLLLK